MRKFITLLIYFSLINCYSQSKDTVYFLINKKDTLIKKHKAIKSGYNTYSIYSTEKKRVKKNNTPVINGKVWVADTKYDYYVYERDYLSFSFFEKKEKLISKKCLTSLNYINNRDDFLRTEKLLFNYSIFFIEQINNENYIIREMYPITFE